MDSRKKLKIAKKTNKNKTKETDSDDLELEPAKEDTFFNGLTTFHKGKNPNKNILKNFDNEDNLEKKSKKLQKLAKKHEKKFKKAEKNLISEKENIKKEPKEQTKLKKFSDLNLIKPLLKVLDELSFENPTKIQELAIPFVLSGKDILASSVTGSGKTAAFLLPILQKYYLENNLHGRQLFSKVLIIIPTRELAIQCYEMLEKFNKYTKVSNCLVIGAANIKKQEAELRLNPDIIIATPGRIIDLVKNSKNIDLDNIETLVLDEADKLLELGFDFEIKEIVRMVNPERQTLLFSATLNQISELISVALKNPVKLQADPNRTTCAKLRQEVFKIRNRDIEFREACLLYLIHEVFAGEKTIVFFKTKKECHRMGILLGLSGLRVCELHSNLSQIERISAFGKFKENEFNVLLATDLASRGLDIPFVKIVINFELPLELTRYIHRVGRTARMGQKGISLTIVDELETKKIKQMIKKNKDKIFVRKYQNNRIEFYLQQVDVMEKDYEEIMRSEKEDKELKYAEMEAKKAENMLKYQDEIMGKPRKEWIINRNQKNEISMQEKIKLGIEEKDDDVLKEKMKKKGKNQKRKQY